MCERCNSHRIAARSVPTCREAWKKLKKVKNRLVRRQLRCSHVLESHRQSTALDLNMPRKDGRETLLDIRGDESLKHLPVIVLTTSDDARDVTTSYRNGANCFITKPAGLDEFERMVHAIVDFWFSVVRLPPH